MRNVNYIAEMNVLGCSEPDIYVIVRTGFQAAAPALLTLFTPGCTEIVKMKLGLSPWHRKGIRAFIKGAAAPFSLEANKFLYKIGYFTAERGLYYLMVADVATEFVTTWQSLAFAAYQCQLPDAGTAYGYFAPFVYLPEQDTLMGVSPVHNISGMQTGAGYIQVNPGFQGTLAYSATFDSFPIRGQPVSVETWMTKDEDETPFSVFRTNDPPSQPKNATAGHIYFDTTQLVVPIRYKVHVRNNGGENAQVVQSSYSLQLSGTPTGVIPFGCKPKPTSVPFL